MAADSGAPPTWIRVCAWCGLSLPGGDGTTQPAGNPSVTHGICPACRDEFIRRVLAEKAGIPSPGPATTDTG